MQKLGMAILISHPEAGSIEEQIALFAAVGFDAFFLSCGVTEAFERIPYWAERASAAGIDFEAVHAPSDGLDAVWLDEAEGERYMERIRQVIDHCAAGGVDKLVMHTAAGGEKAPAVSACGLARFAALEAFAQEAGVHLCYENADASPHLAAVLEQAGDYHGFCFDCGHQFCYTPEEPLLSRFGHRLLYTHIHDNFGDRDRHLLPFDGGRDWLQYAKLLRGTGYAGTLTLELACHSSEKYRAMPFAGFVQEAYRRAKRLREEMVG